MKNEVLRNNTSQSKSPYHSPTTVSGKCPDFSSIHLDTTGVRILKLSRAASPLQLLHNMAHACQTHMAPIHNTRKRDSLVEVQGWTNVGQASRPCTSPPGDLARLRNLAGFPNCRGLTAQATAVTLRLQKRQPQLDSLSTCEFPRELCMWSLSTSREGLHADRQGIPVL